MRVIWRINIGARPIYAAGIDLGQLMHVLYPLRSLNCATFNSRPSGGLTFQLSCCYFAAAAAWHMRVTWRIHIGARPKHAAEIDLGQLMHVLYPLRSLNCATFNSRPSGGRQHFEKPSEKKARYAKEAITRQRKLDRKKAESNG